MVAIEGTTPAIPRNDHVVTHASAISPRHSREFAMDEAHLKFRGRRECRALDAPAASHAKIKSIRA
jgi:hypothetical protein